MVTRAERCRWLDECALMQVELAGTAGDWCVDLRVAKLQFGVGHGRLPRLHLGLGAFCVGQELGQLLLRNGLLLVEALIALGFRLGMGGLGAGVGEVGPRAE